MLSSVVAYISIAGEISKISDPVVSISSFGASTATVYPKALQ